ncbi:MAG: hypothetical protein TYPL_0510 [Candidatus Tyloplasma litorale]|nr:MAG: hypothetical protein TYPL_0510 [Mycoplasmatales bacterium]
MEKDSKLIKLYKIGKSEHKRTDLISSYFSFIEWAYESKEKPSWKNEKKVCQIFSEIGVYKNKDCNTNNLKIGREKSLFKSLNFIEDIDEIKLTNFAKKIYEDINKERKSIFGISRIEYNFLLICLFNISDNDYQTFDILERILKKENYFYLENLNKINYLMEVDDFKFYKIIKKELDLKSGGKSKIIQNQKMKLSTSKNIFLDKWYEYAYKNSNEENLKKLENWLYECSKVFYDGRSKKFLKKFLTYILVGKDKNKMKKLWNDFDKTGLLKNIDKNLTRQEVINKVILRIVYGVENSYENLIHNHLNSLSLFYLDEKDKVIRINKNCEKFISSIINKKNELLNEFKKNNYITEERFSEILNINEQILPDLDAIKKTYLDNYGNLKKVKEIISLFKIKTINGISESESSMRNRVWKYIKTSNHINGICDEKTFFEFIICYAFLIKNNEKLFDYSSEDFFNIVKKSLNLIFSNKNLIPLRFAPGGRADGLIFTKNGSLVVEPTLQLKNQVKMELDSVTDHVNKYNREKEQVSCAYIVAPIIEKRLNVALKSYVDHELISSKAYAWNIDDLIKYIEQ